MTDMTPIFRSLGFSDGETKTYLNVLETGPSTVIDITKKTRLSRQTIYNAIETLVEKGLMSTVTKGKKRYYIAEPPEKLYSYVKRKELEFRDKASDIERAMPELNLLQGGERPTVKVIEGKEGVHAYITDMEFLQEKTCYELTDLEALLSTLDKKDVQSLQEHLKKARTEFYGIYSGAPAGKTAKSNRYFLPDSKGGFKSSISVYGKKIDITTFQGKMYTILIESETLANTFRLLFDLALQGSKDLPTD